MQSQEASQNASVKTHTIQRLQAESLSTSWILLPLEDQEGLVDVWKGVRGLQLDGLIKALICLIIVLLIQQQLSVVVVDVAGIGEILQCLLEDGHSICNVSELVLSHSILDV